MPRRPDGAAHSFDSLETLSPQDALQAFFGLAERLHPDGVASLVSTVTSLIPRSERPLTELDIRNGLTEMNCDVALKLFSSWLDETGVGGFRQLGLFDKGKVAAAKALLKSQGIQLPSITQVADPESQAVLRMFSSAMRRFSQESLGVKAPFGLLLSKSIGSQLSFWGSRQLRSAFEIPLQGHFDWLRKALGVRDVAAEPNFVPMEVQEQTVSTQLATADLEHNAEAERRARDERLSRLIPEPRPAAASRSVAPTMQEEDLVDTKPRSAVKRETARSALEANDQWTLEAQRSGFELRKAVSDYKAEASSPRLVAVLQQFLQFNRSVFVGRPDQLSGEVIQQGEFEYEEFLHKSLTGDPFNPSLDTFDAMPSSVEKFNERMQLLTGRAIWRIKAVQEPILDGFGERLRIAEYAAEDLVDIGYLAFAHVPPELKDNAPAYQAYYQKLVDAAVETIGDIK